MWYFLAATELNENLERKLFGSSLNGSPVHKVDVSSTSETIAVTRSVEPEPVLATKANKEQPVELTEGKTPEEEKEDLVKDIGDESEEESEEEDDDDDDDEEEEESELLTRKKITRIIRVDPDGQRKEFVYEGEDTLDTEKLIEKAIADSPFGHDEDTGEKANTSRRR